VGGRVATGLAPGHRGQPAVLLPAGPGLAAGLAGGSGLRASSAAATCPATPLACADRPGRG
jgi:hypothetical protein